MTNKAIALTTGSTRGLGLETAKQLAQRGFTSVISGRSNERLKHAREKLEDEGVVVETLLLDVTSDQSVNIAVETMLKEYGHMDVLINNAGVRVEQYGFSPTAQPMSAWYDTFSTNLFGTVRVTRAMIPLLARSKSGRVVNVSSLLGSITTHGDPESYTYSDEFKSLPAYSASKAAINAWTVHLAYELRSSSITVNSVHPGYSKTDMNNGAGTYAVKEGARTAVSVALGEHTTTSGRFLHFDTELPW